MSGWQQDFLSRHKLDNSYLVDALNWFTPLLESIQRHHNSAGRPVLVAVNGSQGSGKTTLCDYLQSRMEAEQSLRVIALSLDDFYLDAAARRRLAAAVHPLFVTRGVPGTHDIELLVKTLDALLTANEATPAVLIPRFDKAQDDRRATAEWDEIEGPVDVVLLEGWCLGATAQQEAELAQPVNALEAEEDPQGVWREHMNQVLKSEFPALYQRVDLWVMLQAPSFDCVYQWRLEQEHKLAAVAGQAAGGVMTDEQVAGFIRYYQRLTEHCLASLPERVDHLYSLDSHRRISAHRVQRRGADD